MAGGNIDILTVSEITQQIKVVLENEFPSVAVQGELSNFKQHTSGHLYFTLKDGNAQICGVMWRSRAAQLACMPEDGMKVIVTGRLCVYEPRGTYQIEARTIRQVGLGDLQAAFEKLKRKLAAEGLFDEARKRPIPELPQCIALVTSPTGAAVHDLLTIIERRFPCVQVILCPVKVQGAGAAEEIAAALSNINTIDGVDVVIVGRGGGSMEDLWAFNEEIVARAIVASGIPVVSAVGHEIDFTIADFAADLRAPTPSAAAELVTPDREALLDLLRNSWYTMHNSLVDELNRRKLSIAHLLKSYAFNRPIDLLHQFSQRTDELGRSLSMLRSHKLAMITSQLTSLQQRLAALDPGLALKRGYALVYKDGHIVASRQDVARGDAVDIRFHDGTAQSTIS